MAPQDGKLVCGGLFSNAEMPKYEAWRKALERAEDKLIKDHGDAARDLLKAHGLPRRRPRRRSRRKPAQPRQQYTHLLSAATAEM